MPAAVTTTVPAPRTVLPAPRPALGLPARQGAVLAVLWDAPGPLTAAQIAARLGWHGPAGTGHLLGRLRALGLATTTRHAGTCHWQATQARDDYLAALIAAALDQAADPPAVLRAALRTPPGRP
jgi:predicted transcriptional regulator